MRFSGGARGKDRMFFFEKKNQKTFDILRAGCGWPGGS
jgi:hypothetical protein